MTKYYILPFAAYLGGATLVGALPQNYYPLGYIALVALVTTITVWSLMRARPFKIHPRILAGIVAGVIGIVAWIFLSNLELEKTLTKLVYLPPFLRPGTRASFNPFDEISQPWMAYAFIGFRLFGLAVLVPIVEEVFWRGFLSRWLVSEDWESVPLGVFTRFSFFYVTALFTLAHPEWFAAAVYAILLNGLFAWKKDLWPCIVAHAVSNLVLGIYVLKTEAWQLW